MLKRRGQHRLTVRGQSGESASGDTGRHGRSQLRRAVSLIAASALIVAVAGGLAQPAFAAPPTGYVPLSALINGDSVTTGDGITDSASNPISLEQYAAQRLGYAVTVVTGDVWAAMTAADFAKYQLLIIGDPFCGETPTLGTVNSSTWAPVVMGTSGQNTTVGNRAVIGTDPEWHYANGGGGAMPSTLGDPSTAGAEHLVEGGLAYAGGVSGATGIYFDTSCIDNGDDLTVLNSLSAAGTGFTENTAPPCGGSVQLIASNPAFASLTDADIQGWSCSDHITFPTYPTDWQPLAVATDTPTQPTCGTDPNTGGTACGEAYVLVAGRGIVVTAPNLSLAPATGSDPAGGTHTVTATVTQSGSPLSGQNVSFAVTGQNGGVTGTCAPVSCNTNASGVVTFTYSDSNGAGTDTINASVTISGTTQHATASETWTPGTVNHLPVANPQSVSTPQDTAKAVTLTASDADGDALTYTVVTSPAHGSLSGTAPNLTYTPTSGYTGPDSFTFKANDGTGDSNVATVSITVTAVNRAPTANPQSVSTPQNTAKSVTLTGSDPDGNALTFAVVTNPAHGTLSGTAPNLTYTPTSGYTGPDSFTFKVNDGTVDSAAATVSITVTPVSATHSAQGSGTVVPVSGGKATSFSFNVSQTGTVRSGSASVVTYKGTFTGSAVTSLVVTGHVAKFTVNGTWKGLSGYTLTVTATDGSPDKVTLVIKKGATQVFTVSNKLKSGTITVV
jgi:Bacterial Ig domain